MTRNVTSEVLKTLQGATGAYNLHDIFRDFVIMSMCAVHNSVPMNRSEKLEKKYLELAKKYKPETIKAMAKALAELKNEYDAILNGYAQWHDVLGEIYMQSDTSNSKSGQFFTPFSVSQACAETTVTLESFAEWTQGDPDGIATLMEPTCGSGGMILAVAKRMGELGINYAWNMLVNANDIDERCVAMTYLQCAFLGIPAIITHGNGLSLEMWAEIHTPAYIFGYMHFERQRKLKAERMKGALPTATEKPKAETPKPEEAKNPGIGNTWRIQAKAAARTEQLSLF